MEQALLKQIQRLQAIDPKTIAPKIDRINNDYLQYAVRLLTQTASRSIGT